MKHILNSIREYKLYTIITPICMAGECLMETIIPFIMAYLIDNGINENNIPVMLKIGGILVVCAIFSLIFGTLAGRFAAFASSGVAKNLRHDMYYKVQTYSFYNIDKFSSSSIVTRLTTDVANVQNAYQMVIRTAVRAPLTIICSLVMSYLVSPKISLIFLCLVPILGIGLIIISKIAHPYFQKVFDTYDELNNDVQESIRGIRVVKSYASENQEIDKFQKISTRIYSLFNKAEKTVAINQPFMQTCMYICIIVISWFSSHYIVDGVMTTGQLSSLITYATSILMSLMMLSMIYVMCTMAIPSIKRCIEILEEVPDIKNKENAIDKIENGDIEFKDVSFSYSKDKNALSLTDVNLKIESGNTIGIIGGTGSSKSTLVNLISRLYDTTKGEVKVAGINVKDYDLDTLRQNVSIVLQKNVLFSGTIIDNIRWGKKDATIDEIKHVCKLACADEFIDKLPDGYNTYIEQGGTNVSGGQKQRLCIARALIKAPKILILDDSTSACDTATDAKIRKSFKEFIPEVTKLIIAQRISSVEDADKVIILDDGKVVAFDTPANLLATNKIYQEIYYSQNNKGGDK